MERISDERFITALEKCVSNLTQLADTLQMSVRVMEEQNRKIEKLEKELADCDGALDAAARARYGE